MKKLFNDQWFFTEKEIDDNFDINTNKVKQSKYSHVDVPHDWLIYDTKNLYRDSEGWYKKTFHISDLEKKSQTILEFGGIYMESEIYINDIKVQEWKYGYTIQIINITSFIKIGENEIFVRVKHQHPNSRWYSGAGIYRNVWIHSLPNLFVAPHDLYIHTEQKNSEENQWRIDTSIKVNNLNNYSGKVFIDNVILYNDQIVHSQKNYLLIDKNEKLKSADFSLNIFDPKLWSINEPNLYKLITTVKYEDKQQIITNKFGFRNITLSSDKGLFLNGEYVKLKGVCQHHDLGALGSAENKAAIKRQLELLKEMGVNAIRISHNPFSKTFLELTDQMGFLIQSEFVDIWKHGKTKYDYSRFFDEWAEKDVESWIKHDRNHPSIFMWSLGNEIYDTHARKDGLETCNRLRDSVLKFDKFKNAFITFASNYLIWENTQKVADSLKIVGYNYGENLYKEHHNKYPDWIIYGSETCSVTQSRGVYHFPLEQSMLADDDLQCSSLGNSSTSWGAKNLEECILKDLSIEYSLGQFLWTGFDYIGEPTPYSTKNSYFGQIDTAGFPKDAFYIIQAAWRSYKEHPMIHIFPYWDFSKGQLIDLRVCSNAPKIEILYNGESLGLFDNNILERNKILHNFKIKYEYGKIEAVAYDESNNIIARDIVQSFNDVSQLTLNPSKNSIEANGIDLMFLEINALDKDGISVSNANNRVHIEVKGPGRLVGIDNGNSADYDQFKGNSKRLFNGKLLLIIASTLESGEIKVNVSSKGLNDEQIVINSVAAPKIAGVNDAMIENYDSLVEAEIPIRKIEINKISNEENKIEFEAKIKPENTDIKEIEWRLTDIKGINTEIGKLQTDGLRTVVTPVSDGDAYLRCSTKNGGENIDLYSLIDLKFEGYGIRNLNPYKSISGGWYTRSNVELTNGNERGTATLRGQESWVVFDKVDFENQGSDKLTMSLFPLEGNPFDIEIWQGTPDEENSKLIDTVKYTMGTIWNTYQEQSFILKEKFKGVKTITFVFRQKVHIKEFYFIKIDKSFEKINILENNLIYGDCFILKEDVIEHIGNNVTINFNDFNFGDKGAVKIIIEGQAPETLNSIHLKTNSDIDGSNLFLLDFETSDDYFVKEFELDTPVKGNTNIEFLFLPGSNFNFKSFKFIQAE